MDRDISSSITLLDVLCLETGMFIIQEDLPMAFGFSPIKYFCFDGEG